MIESKGLLESLMNWYQSNCDGDWEHQNGLEIQTLDNPGWWLEVDLIGTSMDGCVIPRRLIERTENDWVNVNTKKNKFEASGGPGNLAEIIGLFVAFVEGRLNLDEIPK